MAYTLNGVYTRRRILNGAYTIQRKYNMAYIQYGVQRIWRITYMAYTLYMAYTPYMAYTLNGRPIYIIWHIHYMAYALYGVSTIRLIH